MRVAIYIRVSTKMQEDRYSLSAQEHELTKYANSQNWEIVGLFRDVDSGTKLNKAGLDALLDCVEEGKIDVVLCVDQDRLSRLNTIEWEYLKGVLRENKVKIAEPGQLIDLSNDDDEFMSDLKNLLAQRSRRDLLRKMMRGKRQYTREGKGWGTTPAEYILDNETGTYSLDENWSWVIPYIDDLYVNKGMSYTDIATELNKICKTKNGRFWSDASVGGKLSNNLYTGRFTRRFGNGETIVVEDVFPRLRSDEMQQRIDRKRKANYRGKPARYQRALRDVKFICGECGHVLRIISSGSKKYGYYFYLRHGNSLRTEGTRSKPCNFSVNLDRVEPEIKNAIKDILRGPEYANNYLSLEDTDKELKQTTIELKKIKQKISEVNIKIDRLLELYLDGLLDKAKLESRRTSLINELSMFKSKEKEFSAKLELLEEGKYSYDTIFEYLTVASQYVDILDDEDQRNIISSVIPVVIVNQTEMKLQCKLPNGAPLSIPVPVAPDPFPLYGSSKEFNPKIKYERLQKLIDSDPSIKNQADLCKKSGVAKSTVINLRKRFGDFKGFEVNKKNPHARKAEIEAFKKDNPSASVSDIAKALKCSESTVRRLSD